MQEPLTFRPVQKQDFPELAQLISKAWRFNEICSPGTARQMSLLYLSGCLCAQTYTQAALRGSHPAGVIIGKNLKKFSFSPRYFVSWMKALAELQISQEGRRILQLFEQFARTDAQLLQESGQVFDAELSFFAVQEKEQGQGTGQILYQNMMDYFQQEHIKNFYLLTDTRCNLAFYEHRGMQKIGEASVCLPEFSLDDSTFFLFAKHRF